MSEKNEKELNKEVGSKPATTKTTTTKTTTTKTAATKPGVKSTDKKIVNANFTVSKKSVNEWTVKRDGVDGYSYHKSKAQAFAKAESVIREVKNREGRIKIHEDGGYTSNWFIESNKQAKLSSGNQDAEILALLKIQKEKIQKLNKVKADSPAKTGPSTLAKEAKEEADKANVAIKKLDTEHEKLRKADETTDKEVALIKEEVQKIISERNHIRKSTKLENILLGIIFVLVIAMFIYMILVASGAIDAPWSK